MQPIEKIDKYVNLICEQIRWKKTHPGISEEMHNHIIDQRDAFMAEGLDEDTATDKAILETGDAATIGTQLDRTHRPKPQWFMLSLTAALIAVGLFLRIFCISDGDIRDPRIQLLSAGITVLVMLAAYFLDFSLIGKYPKILYCLFIGLFILSVVSSVEINSKLYYPQFLAIFTPLFFVGIVYSMRNKGYGGIILCGVAFAIPAYLILLIPSASLLLMSALCCLMLLITAICKDWFGVKRRNGILLVAIPTMLIGAFVFTIIPQAWRRLAVVFNPHLEPLNYGWEGVIKRALLANSRLIGRGTMPETFGEISTTQLQFILPSHTADNFLTYLIFNIGWLAAIALLAVIAFFIVKGFMLCLKQKSILGLLVSLSVMGMFTMQIVGYVIWNMGISFSAPISLPFISKGDIASITNGALIGLMLSCFRTGDVVRDKRAIAPEKVKNRFITWSDGKIIITLK